MSGEAGTVPFNFKLASVGSLQAKVQVKEGAEVAQIKAIKNANTLFLEEQKMCLEINFLCKESPTSDFVQESKKRIEREKI